MSEEPEETVRFSPIGFVIGFPLGLPIAFALDNMALFPVFGLLFGIPFAVALSGMSDTVDDDDSGSGPS